MRDLIIGTHTVKESEFYEQYSKIPKDELIKELITKFENNRTAHQFNKFFNGYFSLDKINGIVFNINLYIKNLYKTNPKKAEKYIKALISASETEQRIAKKTQRKLYYGLVKKQSEKALRKMQGVNREEQENWQNQNLEVMELISKISSTNFYNKNKQHSIEHIQKVIIFADILARGEKLIPEDRKLLLVAAAFHDIGRQGRDGNENHAESSAKIAGEILRKINDYGIENTSEIAIIQTAIHYHEYEEKIHGKIDKQKIQELAKKYGKENGVKVDIEQTKKICELLKDADALDRYRFAETGKLKPEFLRSNTAKKKSTISYAQKLNEIIAENILIKIYGYKKEKIKSQSAVIILSTVRRRKCFEAKSKGENYIEKHLNFEDLIAIYVEKFPQKQNIKSKDLLKKILDGTTDFRDFYQKE